MAATKSKNKKDNEAQANNKKADAETDAEAETESEPEPEPELANAEAQRNVSASWENSPVRNPFHLKPNLHFPFSNLQEKHIEGVFELLLNDDPAEGGNF